MRLGHGHRRSVLVLWAWTLLLSALVLYPAFYPRWNAAIPIGFAVLAAASTPSSGRAVGVTPPPPI